jgi:hypothetical protein
VLGLRWVATNRCWRRSYVQFLRLDALGNASHQGKLSPRPSTSADTEAPSRIRFGPALSLHHLLGLIKASETSL